MKRILSLVLVFALLLVAVCGNVSAQIIANTEDSLILYDAEEIFEVDALIQRSRAGIDDLKANTEYQIVVTSESSTFSTRSVYEQPSEIFISTQLLRSELISGEQVDTYVAAVVRDISYNDYQAKTDGYLVSRLYFNYNNDNGSVQLSYSNATVSTGSASSLIMVNGIQPDFFTNRISTSTQYGYPTNGTYTLNRASSLWLSDSSGYLYLNNRLTMNNGTVYTTEFFLDRYGHFA